jgi:4-aminobutyrate aminotransferase-like enzyme
MSGNESRLWLPFTQMRGFNPALRSTRPIGNVVQLAPPLCSTDVQIDAFFDALEAELAS